MADRVHVQATSDRPNLRAGNTIELAFIHGNHANLEHLTPDQAHKLQRTLATYLQALQRQAVHQDPHN